MDTELARTFLTVVAAGNFVKAAERLFITQSTVSARIQSLEEQLGCRLFVRNKAGTTLTASGRQFQKHAVSLMQTLEQARQDVGVPVGFRASLTVGGRIGIWEDLLLRWLPVIRTAAPDVAIRAEIGVEEELMLGLVDGRIDIAVMYTPQSRPGLKVESLMDEELVLVHTADVGSSTPLNADYIYIDWGPDLSTGRLQLAADAPAFRLPVYLVYPLLHDHDVFDMALEHIRTIASEVASLQPLR